MLTVGDRLPEFDLQAVVSLDKGHEFASITHRSYPGKWLVLFAWPMDFTFVSARRAPTSPIAMRRCSG
jgi:lipoyl-dependent peroxiredoxin subunit C